ncbi:MAG: hypothetical protein ABII71_00115 [Candidatus Micrarchaeota archaeon]
MRNYIAVLATLMLFLGCLGPEPVEEAPEPAPPAVTCEDTDGGPDGAVGGTVTANGIPYKDVCENGRALREYYCSGAQAASRVIDCGDGFLCSDGACVAEPEEEPKAPECTETDDGKEYGKSGILTYHSSTYTDLCQGNYDMIEYYCENDAVKQENHHCSVGERCTEGACISQDRSCTDSDAADTLKAGTTSQFGGGQFLEKHTDTCADGYSRTEYYCEAGELKSRVEPCPTGNYCEAGSCRMLCYDSDEGKEFDEPAYVRVQDGIYTDYCSDGFNVVEYYCSGDLAMSIEKNCELYCFEGECLDAMDVRCNDKYGGEVELLYGEHTLQSATDYCLDYNTLRDYICVSDAIEYVNDRCEEDELCYNSQCVRIYTPTCFDLDDYKGDNAIYVKSHVVKTTNNSILEMRQDECQSDVSVKEYTCVDGSFGVEFITCPNGEVCNDGVCTYTLKCTETDGGMNLQPGSTSLYDGKTLITKEDDACVGDRTVYEVYCTEDGRIAHTNLSCPEGMVCDSEDGSCKPEDD